MRSTLPQLVHTVAPYGQSDCSQNTRLRFVDEMRGARPIQRTSKNGSVWADFENRADVVPLRSIVGIGNATHLTRFGGPPKTRANSKHAMSWAKLVDTRARVLANSQLISWQIRGFLSFLSLTVLCLSRAQIVFLVCWLQQRCVIDPRIKWKWLRQNSRALAGWLGAP